MTDWDAGLYQRFITERTQPAIDLAARIPLLTPHSAIDIGCGPGNSTRVLKNRYPRAQVTGADRSREMLEAARKNEPDLEFILFDAERDFEHVTQKYDIVFSNACIQWVPDHPLLLRRMMGLLNPGGVLAVQYPDNLEEPVHRIIRSLSESEKWRDKLEGKRSFFIQRPAEYHDMLSALTDRFTLWRTTYFHRMPSAESIVEWYRGTGMRPYLNALDENEQKEFEQDVLQGVRAAYPVQKNGEVILYFPRMFFMAQKR